MVLKLVFTCQDNATTIDGILCDREIWCDNFCQKTFSKILPKKLQIINFGRLRISQNRFLASFNWRYCHS